MYLKKSIEKKFRPEAIVLFGSYSRGEDDIDSDIDLAIINGKQEEIDKQGYEEELGKDISFRIVDISETSENIVKTFSNGIVLRGYLDI